MDIVKFLTDAPKMLGELGSSGEVIGLLQELAENSGVILARLPEVADLPMLVERIRDDVGVLKPVFEAAGLVPLFERLEAIKGRLESLPSEVGMLLKPLSTYEEKPTGTAQTHPLWSVGADEGRLGWSTEGDLLTPRLAQDRGMQGAFSLGGAVSLDCEAGSLWFYARDEVPAMGLVRLGISGSLEASASGNIPFSMGSLSGEAEAGATCSAHLFWRRPAEQLYVTALADIISAPVDLFDLEAVWKAAFENNGFQGFVLAIDGHATVSVSVGIAKEFDLKGLFDAKAGLTVSVDLARKAAYELSVLALEQAGGRQALRIVLSHGAGDVDKWSVGLGLDIDAAPLFARVGGLLKEATTHWNAILDDIKPFLTPGTWLQEKAQGRLDDLAQALLGADSAAAQALQSDLRLASGGAGDAQDGLAHYLQQLVISRISQAGNPVTARADALVGELRTQIARRLPAFADSELAAMLDTHLAGLVGNIREAFEAKVTALATEKRKPIAAALGALGEEVSDKADRLDERLAGIRRLVDRFGATLAKLVEATGDAAKAKIAARLAFEETRVDNQDFEFAGLFIDPAQPAARTLYRSLLQGNLKGLQALVRQPASIDAFVLDEAFTTIHRFTQVSTQIGYELVFLGIDLTGKGVSTGNADIVLKKDEISLKASAFAQRTAKGIKQRREATFVETFALLLARLDTRPRQFRRGITLDLSTVREDEMLEVREIGDFLGRLVGAKLISEARSIAMQRYLEARTRSRGDSKLGGIITIAMTLGQDDIASLISLGGGIDVRLAGKTTNDAARRIFMTALDAMFLTGEWPEEEFDDFIEQFMRTGDGDGATRHEKMKDRLFRHRMRYFERFTPGSRTGPGTNLPVDYRMQEKRVALADLIILVANLAAIWNATPRVMGNESDPTSWDLERYRDAQKEIADCARSWLMLNKSLLLFFKGGVHRRLIAFLIALIGLSGAERAENGTYDPLFRLSLALTGEEPVAF